MGSSAAMAMPGEPRSTGKRRASAHVSRGMMTEAPWSESRWRYRLSASMTASTALYGTDSRS